MFWRAVAGTHMRCNGGVEILHVVYRGWLHVGACVEDTDAIIQAHGDEFCSVGGVAEEGWARGI